MGEPDRVLGFAAFAARRRRGRLARTWWGQAWVAAAEDISLDSEPLRQGRRYAYAGHVGSITVSPGRLAAPVFDVPDTPHHTVVVVEQLSAVEWERFLDQVSAQAGHLAALLDRELPADLVGAVEDAGVRLMPGAPDLEPRCDCPGWEHPCRHAAALCYQASWLLDEDPFVLLLLRGRGERELLVELQRRNALHWEAPPGGPAAARPPAGPPPDPPPLPEAPAPVPGDLLPAMPAAPGVDPDALRLLAADAAVRARELLTTGTPPPDLDERQDAVRLAATHRDARPAARLWHAAGDGSGAGRSGRARSWPERAVRAWEYGGPAGLEVLERAWTPARREVARARAALAAAWDRDESPQLDGSRNRWTVRGHGLQLRLGRDGRWYPFREESGEWWPAGPPHRDPAAVLAELLGG